MSSIQPSDLENWSFHDSTFCREIRRVNRNRILLCLVVFILIFYFDTMSTIYRARLAYSNPQEITSSEISAIDDPLTDLTSFGFSANYESSTVFDQDPSLKRLMYAKNGSCHLTWTPSAFHDLTSQPGGATDDVVTYTLAQLDDGTYIVVKRSTLVQLDRLTGTLGYLPDDLCKALLNCSDIDSQQLRPLIFDATAEAFSSVGTSIVFSSILIAVWGLWLFFTIRRAVSLQRDPAYRRLFACLGSVEDNARQIDEELAGIDCYSAGRITVTEHWRLHRHLFKFLVEPRSCED